jgi:hypothetical protein
VLDAVLRAAQHRIWRLATNQVNKSKQATPIGKNSRLQLQWLLNRGSPLRIRTWLSKLTDEHTVSKIKTALKGSQVEWPYAYKIIFIPEKFDLIQEATVQSSKFCGLNVVTLTLYILHRWILSSA